MISICITTIGPSKELDHTVESILNEFNSVSVRGLEVIICNGSNKIIENNSDQRVKILNIPDNNLYTGMNNCIKNASQELLWFINTGDKLIAGVLEEVITKIRKNANIDNYFFNVLYPNNNIGKVNIQKFIFSHQGLIYKKMLHSKNGYYLDTLNFTASDFLFFYSLKKGKNSNFSYTYFELPIVEMAPNGLSSKLSHYIQRDFFIFIIDNKSIVWLFFKELKTIGRYILGKLKRRVWQYYA